MTPIQLITISREFGASGSLLGRLLAQRLGWRLLDNELGRTIAQRLDCSTAEIAIADEHAPSLIERVAAAFTVAPPEAPILLTPPPSSDPDRVAACARAVLMEAVRSLPLIVIGHGAQCLFHDRSDALHLRLVAPSDRRISTVQTRSGQSRTDAAEAVRHRDIDRAHYLRRYYDADWTDPHLYALEINTGVIPVETAAELVLELVHLREEAAVPTV